MPVERKKERKKPLRLTRDPVAVDEFAEGFLVRFADGNHDRTHLNVVLVNNVDGIKCHDE